MEDGFIWLTLPARVASLERFTEFVQEGARRAGLPESEFGKLELVLEEILVNVALHAYAAGETGEAEVGYAVAAPGRLSVRVRDRGVAFNPLEQAPPDLTLRIEQRPVGGLGVFLIQTLCDSVTYMRLEGCNVLSFGFSAAPGVKPGVYKSCTPRDNSI